MKGSLQKKYPFFDDNALDAARFLFGAESDDVVWHEGWLTIDDLVEQEDDFDDFCEYAIDDEMCRMMGRKLMRDREDARWNFEWLKDKEERCYGLVYKETGRVIGNITVGANIPTELLELEKLKGKVGKSLSLSISRSYQRKGLMLEAVNAVIKHLFDTEGMDYIQCGHFPFNTASEMLQKKLGFEYLTILHFYDEGTEIFSIENILWK